MVRTLEKLTDDLCSSVGLLTNASKTAKTLQSVNRINEIYKKQVRGFSLARLSDKDMGDFSARNQSWLIIVSCFYFMTLFVTFVKFAAKGQEKLVKGNKINVKSLFIPHIEN